MDHKITDEDEFLVLACDGTYIYPEADVDMFADSFPVNSFLSLSIINRYLGLHDFTGGSDFCPQGHC